MKTPKEWLTIIEKEGDCVIESTIAAIQLDALKRAAELAGNYLQSMGSRDGMAIAALIYRDIQDEADKLTSTNNERISHLQNLRAGL